jgi:hypothetical protein
MFIDVSFILYLIPYSSIDAILPDLILPASGIFRPGSQAVGLQNT